MSKTHTSPTSGLADLQTLADSSKHGVPSLGDEAPAQGALDANGTPTPTSRVHRVGEDVTVAHTTTADLGRASGEHPFPVQSKPFEALGGLSTNSLGTKGGNSPFPFSFKAGGF